jgi:uncharacterized protein YlzI (FlbEa/FlbD family)
VSDAPDAREKLLAGKSSEVERSVEEVIDSLALRDWV